MAESMTSREIADEAPIFEGNALEAHEDSAYFTATLTIAGFALFWACIAVILFSNAFGPLTTRPMDGFLLRFVFLVGFFVSNMLVGKRYAEYTRKPSARNSLRVLACIMLGIMSCLASIEGWGASAPLVAQGVVWLVFGLVMGLMLHFWGFVWNGVDADRSENSFCSCCIAGSVFLAAVICTFMLFAPSPACIIATLLLFVASSVLQWVCGRRLPKSLHDVQNVLEANLHLSPEMATPLSASFALGAAFALNGLCLGVTTAFPIALIGIGAGSLVALSITRIMRRTPRTSSVERVIFPIFGVLLLALPYTGHGIAFKAVEVALIADLVCYLVFHWDILVVLAYRMRVHPVRHFSQGLIATSAGMMIGWGAVAVPTALNADSLAAYTIGGWGVAGAPAFIVGMEPGALEITVCLAAIALLIIAQALAPYASNTTTEPLFTPMLEGAGSMEAADEKIDADQQGKGSDWDTVGQLICDRYALTPREREVFYLLARGRNAEHISKQLFISVHTSKTHISRIYHKMDINSQQQLIDIVDTYMMEASR